MLVMGHIDGAKRFGLGRLAYIEQRILELITQIQPGMVVYEGYAMGIAAGQGRSFDLGELGGILKKAIWERGIDILLVPPSSLKKFATGKGNAKKPEVMEALRGKCPYPFRTDDEADAFGLLLLGEAFSDPRQRSRLRGHYSNVALEGCTVVKGRPVRRKLQSISN